VERTAPSFFAALAPDAEPAARQAATDATIAAAKAALEHVTAGALPAESVRERLRLLATIVTTTREHLGDAAAAEISRFLNPERDGVFIRVVSDVDASATDIAALWAREFDMSDSQRESVRALVVRLFDDLADVQDAIVDRMGEEAAWQLFAPHERRGRRRPPGSEPDVTAIEGALDRIQAKLDLAEPRIAFEAAVREVLRPEQREHAMPAWGLVVLRAADTDGAKGVRQE
jgi:hypothetical protein